MATNNYNIGSDAVLTLLSDGAPVSATILTSFNSKQEVAEVESDGIDGVVRPRTIEKGWSGSFTYDRVNSTIDDYFALKESNRYAGLPPPVVSISETIANADDGSVSKYRYDTVALKLDDAGKKAGDTKIEQTISFRASRRFKVA